MRVGMEPVDGDRILIVRLYWLNMILAGEKTMEIRSTAFRAGKYYLGHNKRILAVAYLGEPMRVKTNEQWFELQSRHRVRLNELPYKKTFVLPILSVQQVSPIPFAHPRGAVSVVKYRPP